MAGQVGIAAIVRIYLEAASVPARPTVFAPVVGVLQLAPGAYPIIGPTVLLKNVPFWMSELLLTEFSNPRV